MIRSFRDGRTESLFEGRSPKRFPPDLVRRAQLPLVVLHNAKVLADLRTPPGNRLEALSGNRKGQHSVRINGQWHLLPVVRWRCLRRRDCGLSLMLAGAKE